MSADDLARREAEAAAAEAGRIGGSPSSDPAYDEGLSEAERPLVEAGQGEAEGFEESERELIENAGHGDQHAARRAIEDAPIEREDARAQPGGEADEEHSSEREPDDR